MRQVYLDRLAEERIEAGGRMKDEEYDRRPPSPKQMQARPPLAHQVKNGTASLMDSMSIGFTAVRRGLQGAYDRPLRERESQDPAIMFVPTFEALNWAVVVAEHECGPPNLCELQKGLRFVRNRVHHDLADPMYTKDGAVFPIRFPSPWREWCWKDRTDLPPPMQRPGKGQEKAYDQHLAGQPVRLTICKLLESIGGKG